MDFETTKAMAIREWHKLCVLHEEGLTVFSKTVADVAKLVLEELEARLKAGAISAGFLFYRRTVINRFIIPFFKNIQVNSVTKSKMDEFWKWRVNYWGQEENRNSSIPLIATRDSKPVDMQCIGVMIRKNGCSLAWLSD